MKRERLHPESYRTIRELVKLHGSMAVINAVYKIAEEMSHEQLARSVRNIPARDTRKNPVDPDRGMCDK